MNDIGLGEYEGNNPNFVFQVRFRNNGFYTDSSFGGNEMLPIERKKIRQEVLDDI